jgi:RNA polymerase sigma factor (sigma-70 family)
MAGMAEVAAEKNNIIQTIKSYGNQLFGFIRSRVPTNEDAEDILQDVWYQLSNQDASEEIDSISGWLHRVARNKITDKYRKKKEDRLDDFFTDDEDGAEYCRHFFGRRWKC